MTKLRVRARAVDMLGRQQIAGIPTAIHELFKNAHDAYAERVEVDFFRKNRVLVLRDDGYGMTREDVENRWLMLGTNSRVNANQEGDGDHSDWRGPRLPRPEKRSIMGEKGIGRLAIAVIAPITIMLTRAVKEDGLHNLVMAVIHWGLFEQPGLALEDIDIPVNEYPGGQLPSKADLALLLDRIQNNIDRFAMGVSPEEIKKLELQLNEARKIAPDALDQYLNKDAESPLSLTGEGFGTHFILLPVADELDDDIDNKRDSNATKLEVSLLGFSNTMSPNSPVIKTEFRDHRLDGDITPRIGGGSFFNDEEIEGLDHYFEGRFDEYGHFNGHVSVYGKVRPFVFNWPEGKGNISRCGPFKFRFGFLHGQIKDSMLTNPEWGRLIDRLDTMGGIYVYRDGIRILPYGNDDADWLGLEVRRSRAYKDWLFSYRRVIGYVETTHRENSALSEKAGREGFRENFAFRDLKSILIGLMKQLAIEFFRSSSPQNDDFIEIRAELNRQHTILDKQKDKTSERRKEFIKLLDAFHEKYESGYYKNAVSDVVSTLEEMVVKSSEKLSFEDDSFFVASAGKDARRKLKEIENAERIVLPKNMALTKSLERDWVSYKTIWSRLVEETLKPAFSKIDEIVDGFLSNSTSDFDQRTEVIDEVSQGKDRIVSELAVAKKEASDSVVAMQKAVSEFIKTEYSKSKNRSEQIFAEFMSDASGDLESIREARARLESDLSSLAFRELELLKSIKNQMDNISKDVSENTTAEERIAAVETRNNRLEEQLDFYSDFAQIGMSVGILQHEFQTAARGVKICMTDLKPWADRNPPLKSIYNNLRVHIDHLDGYLSSLDPVGRRLRREQVLVSGGEIYKIIYNIFTGVLSDNNIDLYSTSSFLDFKVKVKISVLIGAFVNVVDNAIYWLSTQPSGLKRITLDSDGEGYLLSNNGPGIDERFASEIFEFGESRKPGGRGMGLAISKSALNKEGFELALVAVGRDVNPVFKISKKVGVSDE
jgi:signal transduction histidine kinase